MILSIIAGISVLLGNLLIIKHQKISLWCFLVTNICYLIMLWGNIALTATNMTLILLTTRNLIKVYTPSKMMFCVGQEV